MKNIEINDENVELYQKFYDVATGKLEIKHVGLFMAGGVIAGLLILGAFIGGFGGYVMILKHIITTLGISLVDASALQVSVFSVSSIAVYYGFASFLLLHCLPKLPDKISMKKFQKHYPNFDTNIDINELKKELNKYYELSKLPKDLEKQKEQHLSFYQEEIKEMTNEERIAFLESEREFWLQVQTADLLKDNQVEEGYQKRIEI